MCRGDDSGVWGFGGLGKHVCITGSHIKIDISVGKVRLKKNVGGGGGGGGGGGVGEEGVFGCGGGCVLGGVGGGGGGGGGWVGWVVWGVVGSVLCPVLRIRSA